jgi:hypothetical protein
MFVYVLETNTTGSGLDILRCNEGKCILVTSDIQKYRNDISYSELHRENTISFDTFNHMVDSSNWAGKEPMAIISNSDRRLADAINYSTKLGLPCPNIGTLASFMDKSEFRRSSESNGVPTPKYGIINDRYTHQIQALAVNFPVVVKPNTGTGSIGVMLCYDSRELEYAVEQAFCYGASTGVLIEEYIEGPLYSLEVVFDINKEYAILGITNRELGPAPFFVETGYSFPVYLSGEYVESVIDQLLPLVPPNQSIMLHVEFIVDINSRKPILVEVNPRVGGGMLSRMMSDSLGINVFEYYLKSWMQRIDCTGISSSRPDKVTTHFWKYPDRKGQVSILINGLKPLLSDFVIYYKVLVNEGDVVEVARDFNGPLCSVLIQSTSITLNFDLKDYFRKSLDGAFTYDN